MLPQLCHLYPFSRMEFHSVNMDVSCSDFTDMRKIYSSIWKDLLHKGIILQSPKNIAQVPLCMKTPFSGTS